MQLLGVGAGEGGSTSLVVVLVLVLLLGGGVDASANQSVNGTCMRMTIQRKVIIKVFYAPG